MFTFFKKKQPVCPVSEEIREWMEEAFGWLINTFSEEVFYNKKVLIPASTDFPVKYDGSQQSAMETLQIVARQMDLHPDEICLNFYSEGVTEIETGGLGGRIFVDHEKDAKRSSGLYHGKNEDGKYHISLEEKNLRDPESLVATLAHEIAHVKLLGENRLETNNEHLTDLTTIVFGLGIFNANTAFRFKSGFDQWSYQKLGYLTQIEWGFALAFYAGLRGETNPYWLKYLSETVKGNFKRSEGFIAKRHH